MKIEDIRAVNIWGWVDPKWDGFAHPKPEKFWSIVRHEIQVRDEDGNWTCIPVVDINRFGNK